MRLATLRRHRHDAPLPGLHGRVRLGAAAPVVARRVQRGDIAVIDHLDLDATSAQQLLDAGVAAVVNAAASISGRYPNRGPEVLVAAGVPVLDRVGPEVMRLLDDGDRVRLDGDQLLQGEELVCRGTLLTVSSVDMAMEAARAGLGAQLQAFATPRPSTCAGSATSCSTGPVCRQSAPSSAGDRSWS